MEEERPEAEIREVADDMEREGDRMEGRLEELGDDIADAEKTAAARPEADSDLLGDVAGDWEEEAQGAQQGEDAVDAAEANADKRDASD